MPSKSRHIELLAGGAHVSHFPVWLYEGGANRMQSKVCAPIALRQEVSAFVGGGDAASLGASPDLVPTISDLVIAPVAQGARDDDRNIGESSDPAEQAAHTKERVRFARKRVSFFEPETAHQFFNWNAFKEPLRRRSLEGSEAENVRAVVTQNPIDGLVAQAAMAIEENDRVFVGGRVATWPFQGLPPAPASCSAA